jgi:putative methyltransferase
LGLDGELCPPKSIRLKSNESTANSVLRCSPGEDYTNGFFVSLFVKNETTSKESSTAGTTSKRKGSEAVPRQKKKRKKKHG